MEIPQSHNTTTTNTMISTDLTVGPGNELPHVQPNRPAGGYQALLTLTNGEPSRTAPIMTPYGRCNKNHALNNSSSSVHVVDGCGEFMQNTVTDPTDPDFLNCEACGCHRSFHHKITNPYYQSVHRVNEQYQYPPPIHLPQTSTTPNNSPPSPSPISSAYPAPAPAPHMPHSFNPTLPTTQPPAPQNAKKRFRSKFSAHQKAKMQEFAEKIGWKMYRKDEEMINEFCNEIGVTRCVFKVWLHNHKNKNKININISDAGNSHQE